MEHARGKPARTALDRIPVLERTRVQDGRTIVRKSRRHGPVARLDDSTVHSPYLAACIRGLMDSRKPRLSLRDLGRLLGVHYITVYRWTHGSRSPSFKQFIGLLALLRIRRLDVVEMRRIFAADERWKEDRDNAS